VLAEACALVETGIRSMVAAHGDSVDEHGDITLPPDTPIKLGDAAPVGDIADAELSPDEEREG
jgi:hypothetical protein